MYNKFPWRWQAETNKMYRSVMPNPATDIKDLNLHFNPMLGRKLVQSLCTNIKIPLSDNPS